MAGVGLGFTDGRSEERSDGGLTRHGTHAAPPASGRRYDPGTAQQALALAARLQSEHDETLSEEQVIAIGREAGVDPAFVRRALALLEREGRTDAIDSAAASFATLRRTAAPAGAHRWAVQGPVLYAFLTLVLMSAAHALGGRDLFNPVSIWLILVLSPAVVCALGMHLRSKRLAAAAGGLMGALLFVALMLAAPDGPRSEMARVMLGFTFTGMGVGFVSAAGREYLPPLYRRSMVGLARRFPSLLEVEP